MLTVNVSWNAAGNLWFVSVTGETAKAAPRSFRNLARCLPLCPAATAKTVTHTGEWLQPLSAACLA
jgi:hypothetical protein